MSFVKWMIDSLASEDVIDLYFVISDLKDINQTEAERCQSAHFDSMTNNAKNNWRNDDRPIGKQVR